MVKLGYLRPYTSGINKVSTANEEVFNIPINGGVKNAKIVQFYANADCTILWNNKVEYEIKKDTGFYMDERFEPTFSLIIREPGIQYYIGYAF